MFDPIGSLVVELREDAAVAALTTRIRGGGPARGDADGPGGYQRFVVLTRLGGVLPTSGVPTQTVLVGMRCYGTTPQDAAELFGACADALHHVGPRSGTRGGHIYTTHVTSSGGAVQDPDTRQPYEVGVIEAIATTQVEAA